MDYTALVSEPLVVVMSSDHGLASHNDAALQDMDVQRGCAREREGHRAPTGQRCLSF
jgi:hypothetical protein